MCGLLDVVNTARFGLHMFRSSKQQVNGCRELVQREGDCVVVANGFERVNLKEITRGVRGKAVNYMQYVRNVVEE